MKRILALLLVLSSVSFAQIRIQERSFVKHDTTNGAYTAGDYIGDSTYLYFNGAETRGTIRAVIITTDTNNVANSTFRLYLFGDTTGHGTIPDDNVAYILSIKDSVNYIGQIATNALTIAGAGATMCASTTIIDPPLAYETKNGKMFGVLTALAAYVPKYQGRIRVKIIFGE